MATTTIVYLAYLDDSNYPEETKRNCFSTEQLAIEYIFSRIMVEIECIGHEEIDKVAVKDKWKTFFIYEDEYRSYTIKPTIEKNKENVLCLLELLNSELNDDDCYTAFIEEMEVDRPSTGSARQRDDESRLN